MRESRTYGSVRGASGNERPYRDHLLLVSEAKPEGGARVSPEPEPRPPDRRNGDHTMTQEQKIIRAKVGLLELAKQLGNVSQACKERPEPEAWRGSHPTAVNYIKSSSGGK